MRNSDGKMSDISKKKRKRVAWRRREDDGRSETSLETVEGTPDAISFLRVCATCRSYSKFRGLVFVENDKSNTLL